MSRYLARVFSKVFEFKASANQDVFFHQTGMLFQNGMSREEIVAKLNGKLSKVDTEARISRIFYNKNATFEQGEKLKTKC